MALSCLWIVEDHHLRRRKTLGTLTVLDLALQRRDPVGVDALERHDSCQCHRILPSLGMRASLRLCSELGQRDDRAPVPDRGRHAEQRLELRGREARAVHAARQPEVELGAGENGVSAPAACSSRAAAAFAGRLARKATCVSEVFGRTGAPPRSRRAPRLAQDHRRRHAEGVRDETLERRPSAARRPGRRGGRCRSRCTS